MYQRTSPQNNNYSGDQLYVRALMGHGLSHLFSTFFGTVPNSVYAENIAIMNINGIRRSKNIQRENEVPSILHAYDIYSSYPYIVAAFIFMVVACIYPLQNLFRAISKSVIGGMELFIFGLVAAPGIQILVEKRVDYRKISNQIITGSVLIAGISGISIQFATVKLSGMGLGLVIGLILNVLVRVLSFFGILSEQMSIADIISLLSSCMQANTFFVFCKKTEQTSEQYGPYTADQLQTAIREDELAVQLQSAHSVYLSTDERETNKVSIQSELDGIHVCMDISENTITQIYNDYSEHISFSENGKFTIRITSKLSPHTFKRIIVMVQNTTPASV